MTKPKNIRVTVSMPIPQVERMDGLASRMGLSRNAFMQVALCEYMSNRELISEDMIARVLESLAKNEIEKNEDR